MIGNVYRSNEGRGPLRAKVVTMFSDRRARLYRWNEKKGEARRVYFTLPMSYLESPRCGWKLCETPIERQGQ